jgi:mercuric ion binding protein
LGLTVFAPAHANDKTVTLSVPGMYCEMCPATVSKALKKVDGVEKVAASFETKEAVVTFDDAKTDVDALRKATANAGYPSMVKQ